MAGIERDAVRQAPAGTDPAGTDQPTNPMQTEGSATEVRQRLLSVGAAAAYVGSPQRRSNASFTDVSHQL